MMSEPFLLITSLGLRYFCPRLSPEIETPFFFHLYKIVSTKNLQRSAGAEHSYAVQALALTIHRPN